MKTIGIVSHLQRSGLQRLLVALGEILDVRFKERTAGAEAGVDAWFYPEADAESLRRIAHSNKPCYAVVHDEKLVPCGDSSTIEFSRYHELPPVLKGRRITNEEAVKVKALPKPAGIVTILACKEGAPVWTMQEVEGRHHHFVSLPVPELHEGEQLFQYFHGNQFLKILPLLLFLRTLTEDHRWEQPALKACFMFDDPNLHWSTYGFIDFAQIAAHARMHNYHVSFAMIPQDTWFIHRPTALLFQQYSDRISLLMHGNDHRAKELARSYSNRERNISLRQALRRIDEFERRSGVEVAKVMVPPNGACSENTLEEMAQLGFEAACISSGSLRRYNEKADWLSTLGINPSDIIAGLPVIPRFPLSGNYKNNILIAALLHQPIIARGHHYDVAEGLQVLTDVSEYVNSLGTVFWADMKRISRSHYAWRFDGRTLRVRMFSKRIEVCVPESINQIRVERPYRRAENIPLAWKTAHKDLAWEHTHPDEPIQVQSRQKIEIISEPLGAPLVDVEKVKNLHLWPLVRRQLTETRDRLAPLMRRVTFSHSNSNIKE